MKKKLFLFPLLLLLLATEVFSQKTATHWYLPNLNQARLDEIAKHDILVIDLEIIFNNSKELDQIISLNPEIKILCYVNPNEMFVPMYSDKTWSIKALSELKKKKEWWLKQANGSPVVFWTSQDGTQTQMLNMSVACPKIDGVRYNQFIANLYLDEILSDPRFVGILFDNAWKEILWLGNYGGNKGLRLSGENIDADWKAGVEEFIQIIRKNKGEDYIIITNPGNLDFLALVDGKMFESFPSTDLNTQKTGQEWIQNIATAEKNGAYCIFNARSDNYFFTLCSSVMSDNVYFSDTQNEPYHDYYQLSMGKAKGDRVETEKNLFVRKFKKGSVFINASDNTAWVEYKNGKIRRK